NACTPMDAAARVAALAAEEDRHRVARARARQQPPRDAAHDPQGPARPERELPDRARRIEPPAWLVLEQERAVRVRAPADDRAGGRREPREPLPRADAAGGDVSRTVPAVRCRNARTVEDRLERLAPSHRDRVDDARTAAADDRRGGARERAHRARAPLR